MGAVPPVVLDVKESACTDFGAAMFSLLREAGTLCFRCGRETVGYGITDQRSRFLRPILLVIGLAKIQERGMGSAAAVRLCLLKAPLAPSAYRPCQNYLPHR